MKSHKNIYSKIYNLNNLVISWRKAKKGKTKKKDVIEFEKDLGKNLLNLHKELKDESYSPKPLTNFPLRDPKTRKISKSDFKDRVVHHAIINIIQQMFEEQFIYDSCANQKGKGTIFALQRFDKYTRKITKSGKQNAFCLKADIKHYFQKVNHKILIKILERRIKDKLTIKLIRKILNNSADSERERERDARQISIGMPLGNLTSQFFANVYLGELDNFVKRKLRIGHYIRYVDDFIILNKSKEKLLEIKKKLDTFLKRNLKLELHQDKSRIIPLSKGIDFVGFRNFYHYKLLRKRNLRNMKNKISKYKSGKITFSQLKDSYQGWQAYAKWANTYKTRKEIKSEIIDSLWMKII